MINSDLRERAERLAKLTEIAEEARLDLQAAYDAAQSQGYSKTALRKAVKVHMMDQAKRAKHDQDQMDLELYLAEIEGRRTDPADLTDMTVRVVDKFVNDALRQG